MNGESARRNASRRFVLPSGKTAKVIYAAKVARRSRSPHICVSCVSTLVQPVEWAQAGASHWMILLRCPECGWTATEIFRDDEVAELDAELDRGTDQLVADLALLAAANLRAEIDEFARRLDAGLIVADDF